MFVVASTNFVPLSEIGSARNSRLSVRLGAEGLAGAAAADGALGAFGATGATAGAGLQA